MLVAMGTWATFFRMGRPRLASVIASTRPPFDFNRKKPLPPSDAAAATVGKKSIFPLE